MDDQLRAATQRLVAGGVHVADDHVRREALGAQRVGPAVDGDEHRAHVANVGTQDAQVLLMLDTAHDDERGAVAEARGQLGQLDAAGQELALVT